MRSFFVYVRFPELPASHAEQTATVQAGNLALAAKRGLENIRRREHVRGRRIHEAVIRVNQSETSKQNPCQ
ncbi:MAG: hypothetical protein L0387_42645 [Acidobacteria bacterium]|nr:hypothetical protein [Acidobacteriota bacterium]MCI0721991.1 hypothetical protein [Acidobacteriota bacterium]